MAVIKKYIYYWHVLIPSQACCDVVIPYRGFPICFLPDLLCWTQTAVGHVLSQPRINCIEFINFVPFVTQTLTVNIVIRKQSTKS